MQLLFDWLVALFGMNSVERITRKLNKMVGELDAHAQHSDSAADLHQKWINEHSAHRDTHMNEALKARRVRDRMKELLA